MIDERLYHWDEIAHQVLVSRNELECIQDPRLVIEHAIDHLILKMRGYVLSDHLEQIFIDETKEASVKVPQTWWDRFKFTYKNKWWNPFRKVNYVEKKVRIRFITTLYPKLIFPYANVSIPSDFGKAYPVVTYDVNSNETG